MRKALIEYAWDGTQWFEVGSSCGGGTGSDAPEVINSGEAFTRHYKAEVPAIFDSTEGWNLCTNKWTHYRDYY